MRIIGVDLHARQQSVAMLDTDTGELIEKTLHHEGDEVREFYSALPGPVLVGIEATGMPDRTHSAVLVLVLHQSPGYRRRPTN